MVRPALIIVLLAGIIPPQPLSARQWRSRAEGIPVALAVAPVMPPQVLPADGLTPGLYGSLIAAAFRGVDTDATIESAGTGYGWGLSLGYRPLPNLGVEGEFLYFEGDYERISGTFLPEVADDEMNMASVALSILLRASYPVWRVRPFAGGGVGFVDSDLYTRNESSGLFENTADGQGAGWRAFAGVGLPVTGAWQVDVGWRWIHFSHDLGIPGGVDVNVGGNMLSLALSGGF